jgi:hypothetical protein
MPSFSQAAGQKVGQEFEQQTGYKARVNRNYLNGTTAITKVHANHVGKTA